MWSCEAAAPHPLVSAHLIVNLSHLRPPGLYLIPCNLRCPQTFYRTRRFVRDKSWMNKQRKDDKREILHLMLYVHCGKSNSKFFSMLLAVLHSVFSPNINRTCPCVIAYFYALIHLRVLRIHDRPRPLLMLTIVLTPLGVAQIHVIASPIGPSWVGIREPSLSLKDSVLIFILNRVLGEKSIKLFQIWYMLQFF